MPTWLPTRLLDQAEQRDFLSGVQPYVADLQQQVQAGISDLTSTVTGLARRAVSPAITGVPSMPPELDSGGARGYLDAATPTPPPGPALGTAGATPAPPSTPPTPAPSAIQPFTLPSFESLTGPATAAPAPSQPSGGAPRNATSPSPFSLPSWQDLTGLAEPIRQAAPPVAAPAAGPSNAPSPPAAPGAPPAPGGDLRQYARAAATARGLDPDIFERQIQQESGFNPKAVSAAGAQGIAQFMPATARGVGLADPFEPYAALDAAARHMADNLKANGGDYARALAAYNAGQGNVDKHGGVPPFAETQQYIRAILGDRRPTATPTGAAAAAPPPGTYTKENLQVNQISQGAAEGLTTAEALAVCGPAASLAFARSVGRNPTLKEAKELASSLGLWNADQGMAGPASEVTLLGALGVNAELQQGADEATLAREIQAGRPAIVDSPGHYWVAQEYDPQTRTFDFGQSAAVLKASKGRTRYRLDELASLGMGAPRATILLRGAK